jgi:hypothetical protein
MPGKLWQFLLELVVKQSLFLESGCQLFKGSDYICYYIKVRPGVLIVVFCTGAMTQYIHVVPILSGTIAKISSKFSFGAATAYDTYIHAISFVVGA